MFLHAISPSVPLREVMMSYPLKECFIIVSETLFQTRYTHYVNFDAGIFQTLLKDIDRGFSAMTRILVIFFLKYLNGLMT